MKKWLKNINLLPKEAVRSQKGFSLIEILIALTLLAIAGTFVATKFLDSLDEGKVKAAQIQMNGLDTVLKEFRRKCGFYPSTEQGLEALVTKPTGSRECRDYPTNGFLENGEVPKDPWENDYVYESDGRTFNIHSLGADGIEGGESKFDQDIFLRGNKSQSSNNAAPTEE